jgi:regulation of enolase protein 1 (concanavalin A-like superfamily)
LTEDFNDTVFDARLRWLNEPGRWRIYAARSALVVEPDAGTDFWQRTHYGFECDTGHFLSAAVSGNFVATAKVQSFPVHQYDQAGLMVRVDGNCWIKTSVEYELDDPPKLGVVVTHAGYSDWSMQEADPGRSECWLRVSRKGGDFTVEHSDDGRSWKMLRLAHLPVSDDSEVHCGLYACSPNGAGFRAAFDLLRIERE